MVKEDAARRTLMLGQDAALPNWQGGEQPKESR